ncbi:MAG: HRDC domain-containing protein [Polyangiaceae bacterium]|nr:HRDC domain-containing protein [Polyangiaceae bacterium]
MHLIDSRAELDRVVRELEEGSTFYLDTEFEATREGTTLCVMQLSSGGSIHLIDALRLSDLAPLTRALGKADAEWVLHAGQQDVPLLVDRLKLETPPRLFDTQVAWGLTSAEPSVSLAYLQFRMLGLRSGKAHQADDWKRRPLPDSQLAYAASDIEHLPEMHAELRRKLESLGRLDIVREASADLTWPSSDPPEPIALEDFRNAWQLDVHSQAALRFLITWHNELSPRERRFAPEQKTLLSIAARLPESGADLARIKGVPRRWAQEQGERLVGRLMRATAEADGSRFVPIDPPPYATFEEIRIDAWLAFLRAEVCTALTVAPELALPGRVLKKLRRALLEHESFDAAVNATLGGWRHRLLAEAMAKVAAREPPPA